MILPCIAFLGPITLMGILAYCAPRDEGDEIVGAIISPTDGYHDDKTCILNGDEYDCF